MHLNFKYISLLILAITAGACSRVMFAFINDPEGPNVLVVTVMAAIIYLPSLAVYLSNFYPSLTRFKRVLATIFIQISWQRAFTFGCAEICKPRGVRIDTNTGKPRSACGWWLETGSDRGLVEVGVISARFRGTPSPSPPSWQVHTRSCCRIGRAYMQDSPALLPRAAIISESPTAHIRSASSRSSAPTTCR